MSLKSYFSKWMQRYREERDSHPVGQFLAQQEIQKFSDIGKRQSWEEARKERGWLSYEEYCEMKRKERE